MHEQLPNPQNHEIQRKVLHFFAYFGIKVKSLLELWCQNEALNVLKACLHRKFKVQIILLYYHHVILNQVISRIEKKSWGEGDVQNF